MQMGREFAQSSRGGVVASLVFAIIYFSNVPAFADGLLKFSGSQLEPMKWSELAGWSADDHLAAFAAYQTSCQALLKIRRSDERGELSGALSNVCRKAAGLAPQDTESARAFFEQNFQPVRIGRLGEAQGLLTGYFEPIVAGSRFPTPEFHVPLYRRPRDLEAAGYKPGTLAFPNKGARIGRRNDKNELMPYYDRAAIEAGALDGQGLEICWLKSSSDLLAIQIEGSGRVILEDGTPLRVAFDSHNGYAFSSIERVLIDRNVIPRKDISTQAIRDWMAAHPDEAAKVRAANRSYIFFRITGLTNEGEPLGAQGVPLTPGRSIAVDRVHQYGTPFFIDAELPIEGRKGGSPFRRLMIAQDTGSAIVGPARADLYWGAGDEAGRIAGRIRHPGRFVMLLPRELDIAVAGHEAPLPLPKPKIAELEVGKESGKGKIELGDTDGKSNAKAASIGAAAAGRKTPAPAPNAKVAALQIIKDEGKGKTNSAGASATGKSIALPALKPKSAASEGKKQDAKGKDSKDKGETVSASSSAIAAGLRKSSPTAKSKIATDDAKKADVKKADAKKPEAKGKGETVGASSTAIAAGLHKSSPAAKSKTAEAEAKKQDGKGKAEPAKAGRSADNDKQKPSPTAKSKTPAVEVKKPDGKGKAKAADADSDGKAAKSSRQVAPARKSDRS
jgi:membrane-bound lytic murein transglycosylase A